MLEGVCQLIGATSATGGEGRWVRPTSAPEVISEFDVGFDAPAREVFDAYRRELKPAGNPIYRAMQNVAVAGRLVTRSRRQLVSDKRLLNFFHGEIGPLIGRALVSATQSSPVKLSPRLRQTLACLLEGDSEKQVVDRLDLSHATTHQYVTALYRHFGVGSRAQLMAYVLKRIGREPWRQFPPGIARPSQ